MKYHVENIVDSKFFKEYLKIKELSKDLSKSETTAMAQQIVDKFEDEIKVGLIFMKKVKMFLAKLLNMHTSSKQFIH